MAMFDDYNDKYSGQRCFILGSGPSLIEENLSLIKNEKIFIVNRGYKALQHGLVNKVVKKEALIDECIKIAKKMVINSPLAMAYTIEAQNLGEDKSIENGLSLEAILFERVFETEDSKEGLTAFIEKRKPIYRGK